MSGEKWSTVSYGVTTTNEALKLTSNCNNRRGIRAKFRNVTKSRYNTTSPTHVVCNQQVIADVLLVANACLLKQLYSLAYIQFSGNVRFIVHHRE